MITAKDAQEHSERVRGQCFEKQLEAVEEAISVAVSKGLTCCTVEFDFICVETETIRQELVEAGYVITGWDESYICFSWR